MDDQKYWKALEWRSFLLFYSLLILRGALKKKYWNNLLLCFCCAQSSSEKKKACDIDLAARALKKFTVDFERLYGTCNMSFNVHLMTHLAASAWRWGHLLAISTFPYDSFNGTLLSFFRGTTRAHSSGKNIS